MPFGLQAFSYTGVFPQIPDCELREWDGQEFHSSWPEKTRRERTHHTDRKSLAEAQATRSIPGEWQGRCYFVEETKKDERLTKLLYAKSMLIEKCHWRYYRLLINLFKLTNPKFGIVNWKTEDFKVKIARWIIIAPVHDSGRILTANLNQYSSPSVPHKHDLACQEAAHHRK
jgi:hypothetical protein